MKRMFKQTVRCRQPVDERERENEEWEREGRQKDREWIESTVFVKIFLSKNSRLDQSLNQSLLTVRIIIINRLITVCQ